ncbi:MAG: hypothetical protein ACLFSB_13500 [Chitinispirillaceae bacterium]
MVSLVRQEYDEARRYLNTALSIDRDNSDALYLLATVEQTELLDYESYTIHGEEFLRLADSILGVFERKESKSKDIKNLFYIGNICGGKGIIKAKTGNWIGAVKDALESVSYLKKVKSEAPDFYAAYLGVGVFNYYLSQNLKWIPFLGDKSDEGLRDIKRATQARFPYNYAAKNTLAWILIDRKEFGAADSIVASVLTDYPNNTIFLRIRARIALWTGRYDKAIAVAEKLCGLSEKRKPVNWSDLLSGYQIVAQSYEKKKDYTSCYQTARKALNCKVPSSYRQIGYVQQHSDYLKNILKDYKRYGE